MSSKLQINSSSLFMYKNYSTKLPKFIISKTFNAKTSNFIKWYSKLEKNLKIITWQVQSATSPLSPICDPFTDIVLFLYGSG